MANADKASKERLARAVEAYEAVMSSPNPGAAFGLLMGAQRRKVRGDPFNASVDNFAEFLMKNPQARRSTEPGDYLRQYLGATAHQVRALLADKLDRPALNDAGMLNIEIDDDWRINAFVEEEVPYSLYVSMNLFMFCARISELIWAGIGMEVLGEDGAAVHRAAAPRSLDEVAQDIRKTLQSFSADQSIARTEAKLPAAHFMTHQVAFHSLMALIVCHEFGHVAISVLREAGEPVPFSDRAQYELASDAAQLIHSGRHDPKDLAGLRKLAPADLRAAMASWENEITADLIGVSLATEYVCKHGPWRGKPSVQGIAYMAFHVGLFAQFLLHCFLNKQRESFLLLSKSHPPIDFRMHCVLKWMYTRPAENGRPAVPYGQHPAYREFTRYAGEIVSRVFPGARPI